MKNDGGPIEADFEAAMREIYHRAKRAKQVCHYTSTRFFEMLDEYGAVGTAKRLLLKDTLDFGSVVDSI